MFSSVFNCMLLNATTKKNVHSVLFSFAAKSFISSVNWTRWTISFIDDSCRGYWFFLFPFYRSITIFLMQLFTIATLHHTHTHTHTCTESKKNGPAKISKSISHFHNIVALSKGKGGVTEMKMESKDVKQKLERKDIVIPSIAIERQWTVRRNITYIVSLNILGAIYELAWIYCFLNRGFLSFGLRLCGVDGGGGIILKKVIGIFRLLQKYTKGGLFIQSNLQVGRELFVPFCKTFCNRCSC